MWICAFNQNASREQTVASNEVSSEMHICDFDPTKTATYLPVTRFCWSKILDIRIG